ncbi:BMC domain-containing protein [Paenibacillus sp. MMS20-IR301]|nr:BMC domain-containing protein [Paenibacillus sp. MMS20-IR301]WNS43035.1 BMC domain-containing protein [Paenibacillus sp. MMS20-IR301]
MNGLTLTLGGLSVSLCLNAYCEGEFTKEELNMLALGLIETLGYTTAVSAADAALKAADVQLIAVERIIGVGGSLGVTIHFSGDVAAVGAAVDAGKVAAMRIGTVVSARVIAKAHEDVNSKILSRFQPVQPAVADPNSRYAVPQRSGSHSNPGSNPASNPESSPDPNLSPGADSRSDSSSGTSSNPDPGPADQEPEQ